MEEQTMICPNCGTEGAVGAKCYNCGTELFEEVAKPRPEPVGEELGSPTGEESEQEAGDIDGIAPPEGTGLEPVEE